jgi:3-oxoacyl-[acyl-carrier protein] reductase
LLALARENDVVTVPAAFDLRGRGAVVTGAGSPDGIGFATARLLGQLGAAVMVAATSDRVHERVDELCADGVDARGFVGDLTEQSAAEALIEAARAHFGRLDIVVTNAGMVSTGAPNAESGTVEQMGLDTWQASLRRNLDSAFLVTAASVPAMLEQNWGRIIMVASVTGPVMAMGADVAYSAAKAGMVGLARAVALDVAGRHVTVNAVAPGWVATASQTDHERAQGTATPIGRSGTPGEVASAVCWLASPGASYVTGQCVVIDGGNSIAEERLTR